MENCLFFSSFFFLKKKETEYLPTAPYALSTTFPHYFYYCFLFSFFKLKNAIVPSKGNNSISQEYSHHQWHHGRNNI